MVHLLQLPSRPAAVFVLVALAGWAAASAAAASAAPAFDLGALLSAAASSDNLEKYKFELAGVVMLLVFAINYFTGVSTNRRIAHGWLRYLAQPDGVLARNFAHVPSPDVRQSTWQDTPTLYRAYASGRRACSGAILSVHLKERQDLFFTLWYLVAPQEDTLEVEVFMNEGAMPPTVAAIARGKASKALVKAYPGIKDYTKAVNVTKDRATTWSLEHAKHWSVLAEHSPFLFDLLNTEPAIAKALASPYFRTALISSEDLGSTASEAGGEGSSEGSGAGANSAGGSTSGGSSGAKALTAGEGSSSGGAAGKEAAKEPLAQLRFVFALPPAHRGEELQQLLGAVFLLVDLVGGYKVSPEMRKRAQELRTRLQQEAAKRRSEGRQGQLAAKRVERLEAERAKARAAGPQALAKFEERLQRQQRQREMRKRTIRA